MSLKNTSLLILAVLVIDQISKIYIKTNFILGEEVEVFSWFRIHFIENEGMAWGTQIPGSYGKLILTLFRLFVVPFIGYWLWNTIREGKSSKYLIVSISLIFAGALGNLLDSIFYGIIFDDSYNQLATIFSEKPYGNLFFGNVVDMLYFPIYNGNFPQWLPFWGGENFTFFNAIFNAADTAISVGLGILLVFNKKSFQKKNN